MEAIELIRMGWIPGYQHDCTPAIAGTRTTCRALVAVKVPRRIPARCRPDYSSGVFLCMLRVK